MHEPTNLLGAVATETSATVSSATGVPAVALSTMRSIVTRALVSAEGVKRRR